MLPLLKSHLQQLCQSCVMYALAVRMCSDNGLAPLKVSLSLEPLDAQCVFEHVRLRC